MHHNIGIQKTIKMSSHNLSKITSGKVTLKRNKDNWEISLKAFWSEPIDAQMFIVGKTARKVLDIKANEGSFSANKKLNYIMWNDFLLEGKMIVVISKDIPILKAAIPPIVDVDIHNAMTIIRCGSEEKLTKKSKSETVQKEIEQKFVEEQKIDEKNKVQIKSILTLKPYERIRKIENKKPAHLLESCENCLVPMSWSSEEIDKCLDNNEIDTPFLGAMDGSSFARIEITDSIGFNHMVLGKVATNDMNIYMICIPGDAFMPPKGLSEYNRWIPAIKGSGYWVKYITEDVKAMEQKSAQ